MVADRAGPANACSCANCVQPATRAKEGEMTVGHPARTWRTDDELPAEERRAQNTSAVSENKIHEDDVARQFGFRGGLVPGATTYAYLASYLTRTLGVEWAAHGSATVALVRPVYDGDLIHIGGRVTVGGGDEVAGTVAVEAWVDGPDG